MPKTSVMDRRRERLLGMQAAIRDALRASMLAQELEQSARVARDDAGDTIFGIDIEAERILVEHCEDWAREESFVLVAEGLEPDGLRRFGAGTPAFRMICDPIDGTRGLMFDKRSAWSLAAIAPDKGEDTRLRDIELAVMSELPTTRQAVVDRMWATRDQPTEGERQNLFDGSSRALRVKPSTATDLRHGFATVCNFFQGGRERTARLDEDLIGRVLGGWNHDKAEVYSDQYISSGGQLAELALGRDRFVLDARPLVHRAIGFEGTLCSRPYDLCTALIAQQAGCVVTAPDGSLLDAPLDTTTNLGFVGYANAALAETIQPLLNDCLRDHGLLP